MTNSLLIAFLVVLTFTTSLVSAQASGSVDALSACSGTSAEIAKCLVVGKETEEDKVLAIYLWICNRIEYDYRSFKKGKKSNFLPKDVIEKEKAVCAGYAYLFLNMCESVGFDCNYVSGYTKVNGKLTSEDMGLHAWNVVKINGKWKLVDVTWGSGFIRSGFHFKKFERKVNDHWFTTDPEEFVITHLPEDPMWQLLEQPVSLKVFKYPSEKIRQVMGKGSKPIDYNDSINLWRKHHIVLQEYSSGSHAFNFNERNKLAAGLRDYFHAENLNLKLENLPNGSEKIGKLKECVEFQTSSYEFLKSAVIPSKLVREYVNDMKKTVSDSILSLHLRIARMEYLLIKDSILTQGVIQLKVKEKVFQKHFAEATKVGQSKRTGINYNVEMADMFYHFGNELSKDVMKEEGILPKKTATKASEHYLGLAISEYRRAGKKYVTEKLESAEELLKNLKEMEE